jgi:hypothetical protein
MAHYAFLNNDNSTQILRGELNTLYDLKSALELAIGENEPTAEQTAEIEQTQQAIDAKQQEIDNALCVVTGVITGVPETYLTGASDQTIEQEIKDLEDSRTGKQIEEIAAIDAQISAKLEELQALPPVEVDNTIYWEGYYGKGQLCKRTSYNTVGGVHQNGGIPFRKNYAGVGYIYDPVRDAFYAPQPFASWTLNEETCLWECPVARPEGQDWWWKEDTGEWVDYEYYSQPYNQEPPYPSWSWSTETGWTAPIKKVEGKDYWNEEAQEWTTTYLVGPKPYPSWIVKDVEVGLNKVLASVWSSPIDYPNDGNSYLWNEETQSWDLKIID